MYRGSGLYSVIHGVIIIVHGKTAVAVIASYPKAIVTDPARQSAIQIYILSSSFGGMSVARTLLWHQ